MNVVNAVMPDLQQAGDFFGAPEGGPFVMVNLLKFKPRAEYADGSDSHLTGAQAYARYGEAVRKLVEGLGGKVRYSGRVTGLLLGEVEELWDAEALAEYPSLAAFRDMASKNNGAFWFRRTIDIPADWAGKPLTLRLGRIDDYDQTWFDGRLVGSTGPGVPNAGNITRVYTVPGELVRAGPATLAVRVFDKQGRGYFDSNQDKLTIAPTVTSPSRNTWASLPRPSAPMATV